MKTDNLRVKWIEVEESVWEAQQARIAELKALAESRLEQMNADRKAFNDLRDELIKVKSQLAELRQGGEAMIQELRDLQSRIHFDPLPRFNVPDENDRIIDNFHADADFPQPAIPPGYAPVPIEPTEEMIAAGLAFTDNKLLWHISRGAAQDFYKAMIASAPAIQPQAAVPVVAKSAPHGFDKIIQENISQLYDAAPSVPVAEKTTGDLT